MALLQLSAFPSTIESIFRNAPLAIQIAMVFIVVAITGTALAYYSILRSRYRGYRRDKKLSVLLPEIDNLIIDEVLTNPDMQQDIPADQVPLNLEPFQRLPLDRPWARQALTDRIIHFRRNVRGNMGNLLRNLYIQLELDKDTMKKMKSRRWEKKVQALVELTSLNMSIADVTILPLTNSRNRELRAAARHAYIKLSKNEPFKFFDVVTDPLLMWDQVELFRIITTTEGIAIPNFARWITYSGNKSVVSFCLKLVVHYNQLAAVPAIIKLLDTRDHYLRADAINCLGKLKVAEAEDQLVRIYTSQPLHCQIEILKAIGRISSGRNIDFLKTEFLHSTDFDLRKSAAKSLVKNEWFAKPVIDELLATSSPENLRILKHCMNPLIKY
ncbi:HEAT repeat domain-containing protein [Chitinophaga sp. Mgbs1]|uniref:HEAT repeat domain-containing protein n=1 Tax=Chitinophaga solisilvae TaxID=1233460 RepID=A0A3S1DNN9_9BACT|nr:HEAT repeat domain-containing protein [Chitinophaga solisilvae]